MKKTLIFLTVCLLLASCKYSKNDVVVYKAPEGEALNVKYKVSVNGIDVPVYNAKIGMEDKKRREKAMDVIGDHGRGWTLRIYHTDAALIKKVRFENIRIEETVQFLGT